jgi:lycopene beta-cyclase
MNQTYVSLIKSGRYEILTHVYVATETDSYTCDSLLTVFTESGSRKPDQIPCLQQHFIGWFIKAKNLFLHRNTFMDFSVEQKVIPALCTFCPLQN